MYFMLHLHCTSVLPYSNVIYCRLSAAMYLYFSSFILFLTTGNKSCLLVFYFVKLRDANGFFMAKDGLYACVTPPHGALLHKT
jgi:hypothetical protein